VRLLTLYGRSAGNLILVGGQSVNSSEVARVWIIIIFFALLSVSAATGFPENYFDEPLPRGISVLQAIVSSVGTKPFGEMGGAIFFGFLGIIIVWLAHRKSRGSNESFTKQREPKPTIDSLAPSEKSQATPQSGFGRKRVIGPSPQPATAQPDFDLDAYLAILNQEREAGPVPAWALLLRSPYKSWADATSWLGGQPKAPSGFVWPREADGKPQTFLAQIDLGSLNADPETGERYFNLPDSGALLVFVGTDQTVRLLSASEMALAHKILPPDDLPALKEIGYWGDGNAFTYWPVDFVAHSSEEDMSASGNRPAIFSDRFRDPQSWISNWALAALDVEAVITSLESEMHHAEWSWKYRKDMAKKGESVPQHAHTARQNNHYDMMLKECPSVLNTLHQWREHVHSQPPQAPVDPAMLSEIFEHRRALRSRMAANYGSMHALADSSEMVWDRLRTWHREAGAAESLRKLPVEYQDFVEAKVSDWRSHRLFGIEPSFSNNGEDLRGWSCLISVHADSLLGTETEHHYGMSVWVKQEDRNSGNFTNGQLVIHCAV
jgi:Domain of unknown function (DUF1963)